MHDGSPTRLNNDPAREAVDSLRGYSYQILRSIDAWLDLEEEQILFLEGAEDLDRVDAGGAVVEQVKDTTGSGNITLRSANAITAIANFWKHRERNPRLPIQFRYLTTSDIGKERGDELALNSPGIEIWEQIRCAPSNPALLPDADAIRKFLLGRDELPISLRTWLKFATTEEFVSRIIEPFAWVTAQPDAAHLRRQIEAKLVELGETRHIGAAASLEALGRLHVEAWANVTDANRTPLRRGDLLRILETVGTTAIPTSQLLEMLRQLTGGPTTQTASTAIARIDQAIVHAAPRAASRRFPRSRLETAIAASIAQGTVLIHGSTGMGKTVLAAAATAARSGTGWINLRDLDPVMVAARLAAAADFVVARATPCTVVADDLDAGDDPRPLLPALDRLMEALTTVKGTLLITSAQRLPPRLAATVELIDHRTFAAPTFDADEIATYFITAGCPARDAETWSKIVYGSTSGHPQLVDARLGALQEGGWPPPNISELIAPTAELVDVRAEARRMVSTLSADERELLCRASLVAGRISRRRLMAIAEIAPVIAEPGYVIDRLTGPWLEVTDTADLRTSPLLRNLGIDTRGLAWSRTMHGSIAWAWLAERSLVATDVSSLLMHATASGHAGPLVHILPSLLQASTEVWQQIGKTSSMFALIGVDDGQSSPFSSAIDTAAFRILQLRIAEQLGSDRVQAVVTRALQEAESRAAEDVGAEFFDFLFLWQLLREGDSSRPIRTLVELGLRFVRVGSQVRDRLRGLSRSESTIAAWPDLSQFLQLTFMRAVTDTNGLKELLAIAADLNQSERRLIMKGFAGEADVAALALDRLWLRESERPDPDWARFAILLERTIDLATTSDVSALANAAAAMLIRVVDENVGDGAAALATADRLIDRLGAGARILSAKAKVMWQSGNAESALPLYEDALARFDLPRPWLTDALRDAAIAAARAGLWRQCATRFAEAVAATPEEEPLVRRVGLLFDYGLALHLAGETCGAIDAFGAALDELIEDGQAVPTEPLLSTRQLGSHAIKLVRMDLSGEQAEEAVGIRRLVGKCSALDTLNWGTQRPASLDIIAQMLIDLDLLAPGKPTVAVRLSDWLRSSRDVLAASVAGRSFACLAILTGDVAPIVSDTVKQLSYLTHANAERSAGHDTFGRLDNDPPVPTCNEEMGTLFAYRVLGAVVALMSAGRVAELPLQRWGQDLPSDVSYGRVRDLLTEAEALLLGADDPWPRVVGSNPNWETHALAALGALSRRRTPDELIVAQAMAAHYLQQDHLRELVAASYASVVTSAWLDLCNVPALLVTPRLAVPASQDSVKSTALGWTRTKAVMLAGLSAVSVGAARRVRSSVTELPG